MLARPLLRSVSYAPRFTEAFEVTAPPLGAWPSWTQALHDDTTGGDLWGSVDSDGSATVTERSAAGVVTTTEVGVLAGDQHNSPALAMLPDGRYITAMCNHNGTQLYINISTNPHDSTVWDGTTDIDSQLGGTAYTYPALYLLDGEGDDLFLFFRNIVGGVSRWCLSRSTDDGATWSNASAGITGGTRWYGRMTKSSPTRLDMAFTNGTYASDQADVFHAFYEAGDYHDSDGDVISEPLTVANMTQVYDGSTSGARIPNDVYGKDGDVAIAFMVHTGTPEGGGIIAEDGDYIEARRPAAGSWANKTVAEDVGVETEDFSEGGITIDPGDWDRVAMSSRVSGTWRMHIATTDDDGDTWSVTQITSTGDEDRYPWWITDHTNELLFVWQKGEFVGETDFTVGTWGYGIAA